MLKYFIGSLIVISLFSHHATVLGQDLPGGKWWRNEQVVNQLQLSDEQIRQLDQALLESRRNLIPLKSDVDKERLELEALAEMEPLDEAVLMDRYRKLEEARTKMGIERFRFLIEVRKIVGLQGYRQLLELRKMVKERRAHSNRQPKAEPTVQ